MKEKCEGTRGCPPWLLRLMLSAKIILLAISFSFAQQATDKVNVNLKNASLSQVLNEIKRQVKMSLMFSNDVIKNLPNKDYQMKDIPLEAALRECLEGSGLEYYLSNNVILIRKSNDKGEKVQQVTVNGQVKDENGDLLPGVSVAIKGTSFGTVTDINGKYYLPIFLEKNLTSSSIILVFSFIGMESKEVKIGNSTNYNVVLKTKIETLDDVVVTGYSNILRKSFTGNAKTITSAELKKVSATNVLKSLQVLDPSFRLKVNNEMGSDPNSLPKISLRGDSGIGITELDAQDLSRSALQNDPNLPTFILDGFEVGVSKLFDMDVNRIESITLLKDAAATAIYGSRAANGVVVITTFAPKSGEVSVSYNYDLSIQVPDLRDYNLMNAWEKVEAEKEAGLYDLSLDQTVDYQKKLLAVEKGYDTDWISQPLRTAVNNKHYLRVEGGSNNFRYGIDLNYFGDKGVMKGSGRERSGFNVELQYNTQKLRFRNVAGYSGVVSKESPYGSFSTYTLMNPYEPFLDENGNFLKMSGNEKNPLYEASVGNYKKDSSKEFTDNFDVQYFISNELRIKANIALIYGTTEGEGYVSPASQEFEGNPVKGSMTLSSSNFLNIDGGLFAYYNSMINKHNINAVLGVNIRESSSRDMSLWMRGLPEGFTNPSFAKEISRAPSRREETSRLFGAMLSANYSYDNIYLVDLTGRLDGSSSFGSDSRTAPFWSGGVGVNIHNYPFIRDNCTWLSELKIRGSYGITGKANFPAKTARTTYYLNPDDIYPSGIGATLTALGNTKLKWEKTKITDIGGTIGLWNNRVRVDGAYYFRRTVDLIADMHIASSSGFTSYKENIGEVLNKGLELNVRVKVLGKSDLQWYVSANVAKNKNRIEKISDAMKAYNKSVEERYKTISNHKPLVKYEEGASTTTIYAMQSLGIDPQSGQELFLYKDGTVNTLWMASENIPAGNSEPKMNGNVSTNLYYKGISLDLYFTYTYGGQQYNQTLQSKIENANILNNLDKRVFTDRWKNSGDVSQYKSLKNWNQFTNATSRFVMNDNTFTLQSLSVGYELPRTLLSKISLDRVRFTFSMNDLLRLSTIKQERGTSYPFAWSYNFSVNVGF